MFFDILYKLVALFIRIVCTINGGLIVKGKENVPSRGGVLIAANHISYLDPPIIGAVLPRRGTFMARKGLFKIPVLGTIIKPAAFPVDREKPRPSSMKEAVRRLKRNEVIVIFPEGSRSETGELGEAKRGIGMIAAMSRVPVVPALIAGSDMALPVDAKWLKRAKVTVIFGKPIYYTRAAGENEQNSHTLQEDISNKIMAAIREMKRTYENNNR